MSTTRRSVRSDVLYNYDEKYPSLQRFAAMARQTGTETSSVYSSASVGWVASKEGLETIEPVIFVCGLHGDKRFRPHLTTELRQ